jgi:antitoxin component YwqK of YwqJK toxin-antitoxin module
MSRVTIENHKIGIRTESSGEWIRKNHPENGLFRVYWKDIITSWSSGVTFDPDEGEGLRWEWYYKDGLKADGISKGWYPNGQIKEIITWKDGKMNGLRNKWDENGDVEYERTYNKGQRIFMSV